MKTIREETRAGGFTLLEVLAAMTILTIMGAALFTVFNQSTETWHRADARTQQFLAAREALGLMAMELRQAIVAPNATAGLGAHFYGFDKDSNPSPTWRSDVHDECGQVYFVAPTETRSSGVGGAKQDICVIGYWVKDNGALIRYCLSDNESGWDDLDPSTERDDLNQQLGVNIKKLTFEFWGSTDTEWEPDETDRQNWNSEPTGPEPGQRNTLPQAVRITLVVQDPMDPTNLKKDKKFTTVVRLNTAK